MTARSSAIDSVVSTGNPSTSVRRRRSRHGGEYDRRARIETTSDGDAVDRRRIDSAPDLLNEIVKSAALGSAERHAFGRAES